jgi:hypothetical protein
MSIRGLIRMMVKSMDIRIQRKTPVDLGQYTAFSKTTLAEKGFRLFLKSSG